MKINESGFSLVEMVVTVSIMGTLAAIAVPKFSTYTARAIQSEAKTSLFHIATLLEAYSYDNGDYVGASLTQDVAQPGYIGWKTPPSPKYTYALPNDPLPAANDTSFTVFATSIKEICNGGGSDIWTINESLNLLSSSDGLLGC
jgi:prepilin-type N-terminal cleavage/methylation domain-containing protein